MEGTALLLAHLEHLEVADIIRQVREAVRQGPEFLGPRSQAQGQGSRSGCQTTHKILHRYEICPNLAKKGERPRI